ncbi:putative serine protease K12H4.7-like protein, partial [Leptotrombidium deliense]
YGEYGIQLSNTVLPNGSIDPWHALGLLNYTYANSKSIFINGTAHCADNYPSSQLDSKELIQARNEISAYIGYVLSL